MNTSTAELALAALRIAEEFGVETAELVRSSGVSLDALARPDARVDPEQATRLWLSVMDRCQGSDFALRVARTLATPRTSHIVGYMARNSATLRQAWSRVAKYGRLVESSFEMRLTHGPQTSALQWSVSSSIGPLPPIVTEIGSAAMLFAAEDWTGTAITPAEIRFAHPATNTAATLFDAPVAFDAPTTEIVIPDSILDRPLRNADLWLGDYFESRARAFLEEPLAKASFRFMVQQRIRETLSDQPPTVATVSKRLGMSGRTLQRKLSHEGLQFSDLVEDVRREIALTMVREPHLSVYEIASRLGYQDLQSFRSMFARWTGMTPRDFRAQARAEKLVAAPKRPK